MLITLYNNGSNTNVVDKSLSNSHNLDVILLKAESKSEIHLKIKYTGTFNFNYLHVPEFARYYYITDIVYATNELIEITCKVDVLMSYKSQIRNLTGTVTRNANLANAYINDDRYIGKAYKKIVTKKFPTGIEQDTIYLRTLGRGV